MKPEQPEAIVAQLIIDDSQYDFNRVVIELKVRRHDGWLDEQAAAADDGQALHVVYVIRQGHCYFSKQTRSFYVPRSTPDKSIDDIIFSEEFAFDTPYHAYEFYLKNSKNNEEH